MRKPALRSNAQQQHTTPVSASEHPHMPQQKARQHAPRARWRPAARARRARRAPLAKGWEPRRESRRASAPTHVIGCNNPRDEVASLKKHNLLRYSAAPQQFCETCRCDKRAQISELEHTIAVRGPQSQRKSSSADAPVCKDREHKQRNLSSYCAAPQPLCSASCGCKCARKWHFHGNLHTCQHALRQRA